MRANRTVLNGSASTLAPHGEHDWTIRALRRCDLLSDYIGHLLKHTALCEISITLPIWKATMYIPEYVRPRQNMRQIASPRAQSSLQTLPLLTAEENNHHSDAVSAQTRGTVDCQANGMPLLLSLHEWQSAEATYNLGRLRRASTITVISYHSWQAVHHWPSTEGRGGRRLVIGHTVVSAYTRPWPFYCCLCLPGPAKSQQRKHYHNEKISHVFNFLKFNLRSIYFGKNNFAGNVNVV